MRKNKHSVDCKIMRKLRQVLLAKKTFLIHNETQETLWIHNQHQKFQWKRWLDKYSTYDRKIQTEEMCRSIDIRESAVIYKNSSGNKINTNE